MILERRIVELAGIGPWVADLRGIARQRSHVFLLTPRNAIHSRVGTCLSALELGPELGIFAPPRSERLGCCPEGQRLAILRTRNAARYNRTQVSRSETKLWVAQARSAITSCSNGAPSR